METFELLTIFFSSLSFTLSLFTHTALSETNCQPSSCPIGPKVQFPFRLTGRQDLRCGVRGFDLSCNNKNQTILTLPHGGEFIVTQINYTNRWIFINDPDLCMPKRVQRFNLSESPFRVVLPKNIMFLNCSLDGWYDFQSLPIYCHSSNHNYTVVASQSSGVPRGCQNMSTVSVPVQYSNRWYGNLEDLRKDLQLTWRIPGCRSCETKGLPRTAKYGIIIGVGIPGLVCLIGLACYIASRIRTCCRRHQLDAELSNSSMALQPAIIVEGLDGPTIESYPKTVLGESGRLPKPNDGTCSICLAEYQPKETLRTIPECNHYFHATCIDEWLRMNATCPLCRKSPDRSSVFTPCSSMSSSSASSMAT